MSTKVEQVTATSAGCQDGRRRAAEGLRGATASSEMPRHRPQLGTGRREGVSAVHGEVDRADHHLFALVVEAVTNRAGSRRASYRSSSSGGDSCPDSGLTSSTMLLTECVS